VESLVSLGWCICRGTRGEGDGDADYLPPLGINVNLLAYTADDLVMLAPSWVALLRLLDAVAAAASKINMTFNTRKTVWYLTQLAKANVLQVHFLCLHYVIISWHFVDQFKYLGIDNSFSDDNDINREVKALFARTSLLCRRFKRCSELVKVRFFRSFCVCFYDAALWYNYSVGAINRLASCYSKCLKYFFGYSKYSSVTGMLLELGLPSFNSLMHNYNISFANRLSTCDNVLVSVFYSFACNVNCVLHAIFLFLPRDAMHRRGLFRHAVSVCPFVRPSVTFVDHVKTN